MRVFLISTAVLCMLICLSACRSDADRMAEFCLAFAEAASAETDCAEMALRLTNVMDTVNPRLRDTSVCTASTACQPCRAAVREMLSQCGSDPAMKTVLDRMHFSRTLRRQSEIDKDEML